MRYIEIALVLAIISAFIVPMLALNDYPYTETGHGDTFCAGPYACISLIFLGFLIVWIDMKGSETAAVIGCFITWSQPIFVIRIEGLPIYVLSSVIVPGILTFLIIRMLWLKYQIKRPRPPLPTAYVPGEDDIQLR